MTRFATLAAITLYLGALIATGFWYRRRSESFSSFVTGGGAIPAWMLALSFMANFISSNSFVGHAAKSYEVGLIWCGVGVLMVVCCFVSWHVFAPRFSAFAQKHGATTLPDFFDKRFESPALAKAVNWIVVIATLFYVLAVLRGTALVVAGALDLSYASALLVLYGVTVVYCMVGGLWADVSTDVIQAFVLVAGAIALFLALVTSAPAEFTPGPPPIRPAPIGLVVAVGIGGGVKLLADPKQVMVFYAFKDADAARRFRWFGPLMLLVVYLCLFPVGYLARALTPPPANLEELVPSLVFDSHILGTWGSILFLVALLAASMSSLDSALLIMASCVEKHFVAPMLGQEPTTRRTRVALFVLASIALALSLRPIGDIIALTTFAGALIGAALLPAIVIGFTALPVPARVVGASVASGALGAVLGRVGPGLIGFESPWFQDVLVGMATASAPLVAWWLVQRRAAVGADAVR